jgi:hypoxanthine phosphoribosyltransferase
MENDFSYKTQEFDSVKIIFGDTIEQEFKGFDIEKKRASDKYKYLNPEDLVILSIPLNKFIEEVRPQIIIGCDTGGRFFSLATYYTWKEMNKDKPFPTFDHKIHFMYLKSKYYDYLEKKFDNIISNIIKISKNSHLDRDSLRILFIDDWIVSGSTLRIAKSLAKKYTDNIYFGVIYKKLEYPNVPINNIIVNWKKSPSKIGVQYSDQDVIAIKNKEAKLVRELMRAIAKGLVI